MLIDPLQDREVLRFISQINLDLSQLSPQQQALYMWQ